MFYLSVVAFRVRIDLFPDLYPTPTYSLHQVSDTKIANIFPLCPIYASFNRSSSSPDPSSEPLPSSDTHRSSQCPISPISSAIWTRNTKATHIFCLRFTSPTGKSRKRRPESLFVIHIAHLLHCLPFHSKQRQALDFRFRPVCRCKLVQLPGWNGHGGHAGKLQDLVNGHRGAGFDTRRDVVLLKIVLGVDAESDYRLGIMVTVCTLLVLHKWLTEKTRTILFLKMCSELMAEWRNGLHANFSGQHHLWHTENSGSQSLDAQFFELPTCLHSFPCACHFEDEA